MHSVGTILCVANTTFDLNHISASFQGSGFNVLSAYTADQAVGIAARNPIRAIIVHERMLIDDAWSMAQSLKMVNSAPIVVLYDKHTEDALPNCVDLLLGNASKRELLAVVTMLIARNAAPETAKPD